MADQELLQFLTESFLKTLISDITKSSIDDRELSTPFQELGLDSFRILQVIKKLEENFGSLPKTLLFENFNISDLASYFVKEYDQVLNDKFSEKLKHSIKESLPKPVSADNKTNVTPDQKLNLIEQRDKILFNKPALILERDALIHPDISEIYKDLFNRFKNEGSVSRGTRNIAPNLFIGSEKRGYFNYSRSKDIILVYAYTGPQDYFPVIANEMYKYCIEHKFELNIFSSNQINSIGDIPFSSTPFGTVQRILNLQGFTLQGNKMRRLRYQVSKFENSGKCKTSEYQCGSNKELAEKIAEIIDKWCAPRTMVNPLIYIVKEEIVNGTLSPEHRIFVTYLDNVLENVILITKMSSEENGYLMDLEFYPQDMPLGGLEYAIVKIIETLVSEGCTLLSLGGTYGVKLEASSNADAEVDKILDMLREQNLFNDEGNLQFKNKFRTENIPVYLCRPVNGSNPNNITDIIMMIADPSKMQTSEEEYQITSIQSPQIIKVGENNKLEECTRNLMVNKTSEQKESPEFVIEGEERSIILSDFGYNPLNVPHCQVEYDLKTDSWAQLEMTAIENQMESLHSQIQQNTDVYKVLKEVFPFTFFALTESGRTAEKVLCKAWPKKGVVIQNLLFPTMIFHQVENGLTPRELPHSEVFQLDSKEKYKGNIDWDSFEVEIEKDPRSIAFVCIELNDNAAGGYPVSIQHLRRVKALLSKYSISLVIDGTRVLENAQSIIEYEKDYAGKSIWIVVQEIFSFADMVIASLTKDFCVNKGGIIATNDESLYYKLQDLIDEEGCGFDVIDKKIIAQSFQNRKNIETHVLRRIDLVKLLWNELKKHNIPVVNPAGKHCILIDVKQIPEFKKIKYPVASFIAWMFLNTGIRAGAHNAGMQKNSSINDLVRLAIPIGLKRKEIEEVIERLISLFERKKNIPEVIVSDNKSNSFGDINTHYTLLNYHNISGKLIHKPLTVQVSEQNNTSEHSAHETDKNVRQNISSQIVNKGSNQSEDIAIIGMAGRYPKANNLTELWENLIQGKDCIETIPDSRFEQRLHSKFIQKYRGGFINDIDKFDCQFFSISSKEADMLDPQERLFLEVAWEAIEDAGYYPETLGGADSSRNIGVYVGAVWTMYQMFGVEEKLAGNNVTPNSFLWSIANRVSYFMNLCGPSLTLDTACSSSLTALSLACDAIKRGDCISAIVGGVNLDLHQSKWDIDWAEGKGSISKDGVCRSFGKGANGYVAGEGVGALYIKPVSQAIADKDNIYAVIKSVTINHSGRTSGYMKPNPSSQAKLIKKALDKAHVDARSIGFIEAHGTGTELGDAVEISGLTTAFQDYKIKTNSCPIGTIKTNIGHLEAASGVVAIQKILLQIKHRKLVPSLNAAELNEMIDFKNSPFYVQRALEEWEPKEIDGIRFPLRAGISAFGAGGTNAHVIIEQFEDLNQTQEFADVEQIFPLSARNEEQLKEAAIRLRDYIRQDQSLQNSFQQKLNDIAYTLQVGRKSFDCRMVVVAKSQDELIKKLTSFIDGNKVEDVFHGHINNAESITKLLNRKEKEVFAKLISQSQDFRRIAQLWVDGVLPDLIRLEDQRKGKRVSLPTYSFGKEHHWIISQVRDENVISLLPTNTQSALIGNNSECSSISEDVDKYEFSLSADQDGQMNLFSHLSIEEKAYLFVKQLFATQLGKSANEIDIECNLMDIGVTSLNMAEIASQIKKKIDPTFSPTLFFESTTLKSFSLLLANEFELLFKSLVITKVAFRRDKKNPDSYSDSKQITFEKSPINNSSEIKTQQDKHIFQQKPLYLQDAESEIEISDLKGIENGYDGKLQNVFITGATGFLGIHILSELLNSNNEITAYCLVRASDKKQGVQRILRQAKKYAVSVDKARIVVLCGDINKKQLGLNCEEWDYCCKNMQQIIHTSARVNHIEGYSTFRESICGMKEIIRLASSYKIKLVQFISSIAACSLKINEQFTIFEKEDFIDDGTPVYGGYGQSKWVQETFLKRAHEFGLPYMIYRFGELSGSSQTGLGQTNDMLHRLLQMRLAIGCREKISSDVLDMIPVDLAAKIIVNIGKSPELWNKIVHATHPKPCHISNFYKRAQEENLNFTPVTKAQYLKQCENYVSYISAIDSIQGFVLECILRDAEGSSKNLKMIDGYFAVLFPFDQDNFKQLIQKTGLAIPEWNVLFNRYFEKWNQKDIGFMARVHDYQKHIKLSKEKIESDQNILVDSKY